MHWFLIFLNILLFSVVIVTSDNETVACFCKIHNNEKFRQEILCSYPSTPDSSKESKLIDCQLMEDSSLDHITSLTIDNGHPDEIKWLMKNVSIKLHNIEEAFFYGNDLQVYSNLSNFFKRNTKIEVILFQYVTITTWPSDFFSSLANLKKVEMFENKLESLPDDLFLNNINLEKLNLSINNLIDVNSIILKNCKKLEVIDFSRNQIKHTLFFGNSKKLIEIYLQNNLIENITNLSFKDLRNLEILYLSHNLIRNIECDAFKDLGNLKELYLEDNKLQTIEYCHTRDLVNLKIAKLSHNQLTIENCEKSSNLLKSPFSDSTSIEELYLDNNQISGFCFYELEVHDPSKDKPMKINLSNNKLDSLSNVVFNSTIYTHKTFELDVRNNKITSLFYQNQNKTFGEINKDNNYIKVYADNNPLNCDSSLYELIQHTNKANRTIEFHNWTIHMDNLKCNEPSLLKNTPIETFESKTYKCLLNESNIDYAKCPDNCSCWRRPSENSTTIIDCSSRNLTSGPSSIHLLFGEQIELNLSNNLLSSMPLSSQSGYESVTILDLSYNNITHLTRGGLPIKLQTLYMHNNKLVRIEKSVLNYLRRNWSNFKELTLHDNPWECNCDLDDLRRDLNNTTWSQSEKEKITCGPSKRQVYKLSEQDLCPLNYTLIITICIVLAFVAIVICIVIIIFYQYEERIKIWLYEKQWLLFWVTEEELDKDKYYDAFISYSHQDHDFVFDDLVKNLEKGQPPFKLCVHERDWLPGEQIPIQIVQSIENSKRTIVVLSSSFLESEWANIEFRTAHRRALEDRRTRVIVIKYGELPPIETFDRELQSYLSMYTYLEWRDPSVWSRLRFVMPHKNRSRRPQCTRVITINNRDEMKRETHL